SAAAGYTINVTQPTIAGLNMVQVQVTGSVPYLFGRLLFPNGGSPVTSLPLNRTVTFPDQGRGSSSPPPRSPSHAQPTPHLPFRPHHRRPRGRRRLSKLEAPA